jgi:hypothetical protein
MIFGILVDFSNYYTSKITCKIFFDITYLFYVRLYSGQQKKLDHLNVSVTKALTTHLDFDVTEK